MRPAVAGIRQIAVTVADVSRALEFYRDILGLRFLFAPNADLAFLEAGDVRIMLSTPQGSGREPRRAARGEASVTIAMCLPPIP